MSTGTASTVKQIKRPATKQVWDWRHNFYDFRKAKRLVEANRTRDALPYLEGPHAKYIRARFRSIGREDPRFISALALCNAIDPVAHAQQFAPAPQPEPVRETPRPTNQPVEVPVLHVSADIADAFGMHGLPNTVIEPAAPPRANCGKAIVGVKELKDALKSLRRSIPVIDKIPKGMTDGNGREVKRIVGARRVRFESDGDSLLRLSALDYPNLPAIELTRVAIDSFTHFTIDVETICQIFELSIDDTMSLRVDGSELHIRGSDSHYKLFIDDIADAYALGLPSAKLTPTQWLAKALELAASVTANDADTHKAFDAHMKPVTPAARRKLAWAIAKAKPADANAYAARVALLQAVGIEKLQKWLTTHIGSAITLV